MKRSSRDKPGCPALVLTGDRRRGRYLVRVYGQPVWLSGTLFVLLCQLVCSLVKMSGFVAASRNAVYRLRKEFDAAEEGRGQELIETGAAAEYRLDLDLHDVAVEPSFDEMHSLHVLPDDEIQTIRDAFRYME